MPLLHNPGTSVLILRLIVKLIWGNYSVPHDLHCNYQSNVISLMNIVKFADCAEMAGGARSEHGCKELQQGKASTKPGNLRLGIDRRRKTKDQQNSTEK